MSRRLGRLLYARDRTCPTILTMAAGPVCRLMSPQRQSWQTAPSGFWMPGSDRSVIPLSD
ncbi:MAG: hypothetical protein AAF283_10895 [Cyanobacteria bacterium P01_A01_bin.70]